MRRFARLIVLASGVGLAVSGCAGHAVKHRGYAADGYGVIDDSPHLPPPSGLWQHAPRTPAPHVE
ncbi:hypothetical protein [Swaminathania salitolerans]|uniref:Lipoprotein n=1 Tax=Swaminathania salitolerans TaxID=182838 RepID=A0A511BRE3_9PROT|nr:hypothetical protein [Swaminathania salitolerans]GBQ12370.1 hypothetical protein AA21291_1166 [Swaminathania salitolerans LMG 21291]GEL02825.1 hypothetical protein SSA02_19880 [Swaminathania salitolerans]